MEHFLAFAAESEAVISAALAGVGVLAFLGLSLTALLAVWGRH